MFGTSVAEQIFTVEMRNEEREGRDGREWKDGESERGREGGGGWKSEEGGRGGREGGRRTVDAVEGLGDGARAAAAAHGNVKGVCVRLGHVLMIWRCVQCVVHCVQVRRVLGTQWCGRTRGKLRRRGGGVGWGR